MQFSNFQEIFKRKRRKLIKQIIRNDRFFLRNNLIKNINYPSCKVYCDICDKDITQYTKIISENKDYCILCFKPSETEYHIINKLNFNLYSSTWTAYEELLLLEGVQKFGFANWQDISQHIQSKSAIETECHYEQIYMKDQQELIIQKNKEKIVKKKEKIEQVLPPREKLLGGKEGKKEVAGIQEIVGYMPLRGDFDVEYDNDAELLLAEMEFQDDETQEEIDLKMKIFDIYNARLDERVKRKQFVIERGLLDFQKQSMIEKSRTKEEKEIHNLLKPFARFQTPEDHIQLVQGIIKQKEIQNKIEELIQFRNIGFKTFEEIDVIFQIRIFMPVKDKRMKTTKKEPNKLTTWLLINSYYLNLERQKAQSATTNQDQGYVRGTFLIQLKDEKKVKISPNFTEKLSKQLEITPHEYLLIKDMLIRESLKEGTISKNFLENSFKIERVAGVFDFLVSQNLLLAKNF